MLYNEIKHLPQSQNRNIIFHEIIIHTKKIILEFHKVSFLEASNNLCFYLEFHQFYLIWWTISLVVFPIEFSYSFRIGLYLLLMFPLQKADVSMSSSWRDIWRFMWNFRRRSKVEVLSTSSCICGQQGRKNFIYIKALWEFMTYVYLTGGVSLKLLNIIRSSHFNIAYL